MSISKTFLLLFYFCFSISYGQNIIEEKLIEEGFQNIQYLNENQIIYLAYENNRYRFEAEALAFVLKIFDQFQINEAKEVQILIRHKGIGMSVLKTSLVKLKLFLRKEITYEDWISHSTFTFDVNSIEEHFKEKEFANKSYGKIDLPVGVQLDYQLGNFDNAVRLKLDIQPEISTVFSKGWTTSIMYSITTLNDLNSNSTSGFNLVRISKDLRIRNLMLNFSLGSFTRNRFGLSTLAHYYVMNSEQWRLEATYSNTNFGDIDSNLSFISGVQNRQLYSFGLNYRNIKLNTDFNFRYGKFLNQDQGYKINITRQINEVFIGFFISESKGVSRKSVGFEFQVPIGFKKHLKPSVIRPMTREYFYLPYYYAASPVGRDFYSGENLLLNSKEYFPGTLRIGLKKYLNINE